jgi:hypothetical protein
MIKQQIKLFWLSKIGSNDSFSRIGENILSFLKNDFGYILYANKPKNLILNEAVSNLFEEIIVIGDQITLDEKIYNFDIFKNDQMPEIYKMMKYTLLQSIVFCISRKIDILMITMGVFEGNLLMKMRDELCSEQGFKNIPKIILYTPFDYIPSSKSIHYYNKADLIITTNDIIDLTTFDIKYLVIPHATDAKIKKYNDSARKIVIDTFNHKYQTNIEYDDIIILNANLYQPRKRIESTISIVSKLIQKYPHKKIKLWLHIGNSIPKNLSIIPKEKLIKTDEVPIEDLNLIYNICQIGIQTSWGEGWSFTNCEHAMCGGIQVVPNWLATGIHFHNERGIMCNVKNI